MYRFIYFYIQSRVSASLFNTSQMLTYVADIYVFMGIWLFKNIQATVVVIVSYLEDEANLYLYPISLSVFKNIQICIKVHSLK